MATVAAHWEGRSWWDKGKLLMWRLPFHSLLLIGQEGCLSCGPDWLSLTIRRKRWSCVNGSPLGQSEARGRAAWRTVFLANQVRGEAATRAPLPVSIVGGLMEKHGFLLFYRIFFLSQKTKSPGNKLGLVSLVYKFVNKSEAALMTQVNIGLYSCPFLIKWQNSHWFLLSWSKLWGRSYCYILILMECYGLLFQRTMH